MKQYYVSAILLFSFFLFNGCNDILECIINVRPELANKTLDHGHVNEYYSETITAQVKNEPHDNGYDYYFTVSGNIPAGIEVYYDYREVIFEGIPQEPGRYTIRVSLYVEAINECYFDEFEGREICHDPLCSNNTSRVYTLVVR
ncbi:hypothetical protein [Seonamhaeicola sp.]|uniref:hypothetical protein n=1 Tax=Seonamhaeicola sp. TaxID=1912245 RepID=UPI0026332861|nr:hypothetical protein [Seonamhaeicola sp.]